MQDRAYFYLFAFLAVTCMLAFSVLPVVCDKAHAAERDYTRAVIHHTASRDVSAAEINRWHKEKGWDGIGYHFVIRADGTVEDGRAYEKKGAHARTGKPYSRNHYTGIVLTGYDEFTDEQIDALVKLLHRLGIKHIEGHHEECPGPGISLSDIMHLANADVPI